MNKFGEFLKGFKSGLSNIRSGIGKFNAQETDYSNRSIHENEMREKHIYPEIQDGILAGEEQLLSLANELEPGKASPLIFKRTYDANHDLTMLIKVLHFLLADIEKDKIKKLYADRWPKDAIATEERQRKLKEIRSARAALEKEEEQAILELETQGVRVDRRGDQTPETFLEWDGKTFNQAKLNEFHRESLARQAAIGNLSQEIGSISAQIRELESLSQRAELPADIARFEKQLQSLRIERDKLVTKRDELQQEYEPRLKLYNRATGFLIEHGIRV
jgi:hypothetical protein